jgi:Flp pilus assembly protein TadG
MKLPFLRNQDGVAAVEFALVAPVLTILLVGVGTYGLEIIAYSKMRQAVSSGAEYALTTSEDTTTIQAVVNAAWDDKPSSGATVSVTQQCVCGGVTNDCSTVCPSTGDYPQKMTTISASRSYTELGGQSKTLTASQQVRTR